MALLMSMNSSLNIQPAATVPLSQTLPASCTEDH